MSDDPVPDAVAVLGPFDIYETAEGPRHVENPVRRQLLAMMRGRERTVPEMIKITGLGKSTVSAHLSQLAREGLLDYREDPRDRRCKLYYLTSRHVATAVASRDRPPVVAGAAGPPLQAGDDLQRVLLRTLLAELACSGLDLGPVVRETGRRVGEIIGRDRPARDLADWARETARFWQESGLGVLAFEPGDPSFVTVDACGICCIADAPAQRMCMIAAGLLEGMASESLGSHVESRPVPTNERLPRAHPGAKGAHPVCSFELFVTAGPSVL